MKHQFVMMIDHGRLQTAYLRNTVTGETWPCSWDEIEHYRNRFDGPMEGAVREYIDFSSDRWIEVVTF